MGVPDIQAFVNLLFIHPLLQCQSHTWHNCSLTVAHLQDATSTRNRDYRQCRTNAQIAAIYGESALVNRTVAVTRGSGVENKTTEPLGGIGTENKTTEPLGGIGTENKTEGVNGKSEEQHTEVDYQKILKDNCTVKKKQRVSPSQAYTVLFSE